MIPRSRIAIVWLILALAGVAILLALAAPTQPALADLPPRPTPCPTSTPLPTPQPAPVGARLELNAHFPSTWPWAGIHWQKPRTVVQWQDAWGDWHTVEGWQGELDSVVIGADGEVVGQKIWWVAPADFDTGPFRWLVHLGAEGKLLATSAAFYLPHSNGAVVQVEVSLEAP
jgi:hypothetical protein